MAQVQTHPEDTVVQNLIRECYNVAHWASSCAVRCIESAEEEGVDMCARMCLDAESVAETMAALAARGSPHATSIGNCAVQVLKDCAKHCRSHVGKVGDGRRTMENCAKACEVAVESLNEFLKIGR